MSIVNAVILSENRTNSFGSTMYLKETLIYYDNIRAKLLLLWKCVTNEATPTISVNKYT